MTVPYTFHLNDIVSFPFEGWNPLAYEQALKDEFDQLYEEGNSRRRISLHDRISGHAGRVRALDRFLTYAKSNGDVWFARKDEIARWALEHRDDTPIVHRGPSSESGLPYRGLAALENALIANGASTEFAINEENAVQIAIVGGSLAGLFAATLLVGDGHKIAIYERSVYGLEGRGAGLLGKRDTFAVLRAAGCEHVARVGVVARERIVFDHVGSTVDSELPPQMQIPWDYLNRTFRNRVSNGSYVLGRRVDRVRQDGDQVVVVFDDGGVEMADLAIGADGIASVVRASVDGSRAANTYAGYVGWRGLLPERSLPAAAAGKLLERFAYFRMSQSHVIGFLVPGPRGETEVGARDITGSGTARLPDQRNATRRLPTQTAVSIRTPFPGAVSDRARTALTEDAERLLPRPFADAIKATDRPFVQGVFDYETENMVSGRIALAGDAAFVVRPDTGMGIAKAAGDAMSLRKHLLSRPAVEALQSYRDERAPLGAAIAASGRELGAQLS